jgi:2-oxoacid:acceptor oxidoreductase gamma subunit (pyruvate/2-ketoisovalerate family)
MITNPDYVVVIDPAIVRATDVEAGLSEEGLVVINSPTKPKLKHACAYIDATSIALEVIKRPITNTVMLGAFVGATGLVSLESIEKGAEFILGKKMSNQILSQNLAAIRRAFEEVKNVREET